MKITFLERGREIDFRRYGDHERTVVLWNCFRSGGLLYGWRDRFNIMSIPIEDIRSIKRGS